MCATRLHKILFLFTIDEADEELAGRRKRTTPGDEIRHNLRTRRKNYEVSVVGLSQMSLETLKTHRTL
jgi:hypothetical protein